MEHEKQWGDNVVLVGMAERFKINIHVISSETTYISKHGPYSENAIADVHLGLILQHHYVALDKNFEVSHETEKNVYRKVTSKTKSNVNKPQLSNVNNTTLEEPNVQHEAEDKAALKKSAELCGLPYESGLFNKDPDWSNKVISCAPGEKNKPIPLMTDPHFEQLSNPEKFPMVQTDYFQIEKNPSMQKGILTRGCLTSMGDLQSQLITY